MFSGLMNQLTSWMGPAKEDQEGKELTAVEEENLENKTNISITNSTADKRLDLLTNARSQIEEIGGWLGSNVPKLLKREEAGGERQPSNENSDTVKDSSQLKENDANFSVTGLQPAIQAPIEDEDAQFANMQNQMVAGAKFFGDFFYSAVNRANKAANEATTIIKETIERNNIFGEFNKEQEAFLKERNGNTASALPPWVGFTNEGAVKDECLSLSTVKKNFVRSPPAGIDFHFDYQVSYPVAMAIMEQDPNLKTMRYELVPKVISEENFWRNYFYRISLICQANELSSMSLEGDNQSVTKSLTFEQPQA